MLDASLSQLKVHPAITQVKEVNIYTMLRCRPGFYKQKMDGQTNVLTLLGLLSGLLAFVALDFDKMP